ncbi:LD-carboxypeptidase [Flavicella sp.]|uniref:S66 peptidase family protein n=1 Tax=Flavicella sp. TaxID=2957742 RepID=UPI00301AA4B1
MKIPDYLQKGDTVAIVAPAGIIKKEANIYKAAELVKSWGLHVVIGEHVFDKNNHFSATDKNRLADIQQALDTPNIKAIWCARGGYGTGRIIDQIDFTTFQKKPKWIIGYSDITVLHSHIHNLNIETIHGMMPVNIGLPEEQRQQSVLTLKKALFGELSQYTLSSSSYNKLGSATGNLVGGNLTLLENLLGTSSSIDTTDKILFIEEIGEYKYHIDRLLQALKRNGYFDHCNGIIIGGMSHIKRNNPLYGLTIEEIILDVLPDNKIPVIFDFPAGHDPENRALYLGRNIEMVVSKDSSTVRFLN